MGGPDADAATRCGREVWRGREQFHILYGDY
jgi:hypothetical protein